VGAAVADFFGLNFKIMDDPVTEQLQAYNAGDLERFMACYTDDCVVDDGAGSRLLTGHAEMRPRYEALFKSSPNLHCEIIHRMRIGSYVIDEEKITGRVPAMNRAVVIYRVKDGLIEHVRFLRETD
jgi:hypothetical protein